MTRIDLAAKFDLLHEHWSPRIVAELNGQHVKIARLLGTFDWHHHEHEDELFLVLSGTLEIHFRDRVETLGPGEMLVVPRGVEHRPVAESEVRVLLFEPAGTLNTGNVRTERTVDDPDRI
jgi:mannose-6-phosphate isomerase-like protein (cupin superfamily)